MNSIYHLNKPAKMVLGVLTILPLIIMIALVIFGFIQFLSFFSTENQNPMMPMMYLSYLGYAIPFLFFYSLFYLGLGIFYVIHMFQNPLLDTEKRMLWIVVLITLNGLSMPVYWYIHLWKSHSSHSTTPKATGIPNHESTRT